MFYLIFKIIDIKISKNIKNIFLKFIKNKNKNKLIIKFLIELVNQLWIIKENNKKLYIFWKYKMIKNYEQNTIKQNFLNNIKMRYINKSYKLWYYIYKR